jgi:hypothetical protein
LWSCGLWCRTVKLQAARCAEMLLLYCITTRSQKPEDDDFNPQQRENLKSRIGSFILTVNISFKCTSANELAIHHQYHHCHYHLHISEWFFLEIYNFYCVNSLFLIGVKDKVKILVLFLTNHHAMKAFGGVEVQLHSFFDLGIRWRWLVSFTHRPLYPQVKNPWYPLNKRLGGPQSRSGWGGEEKNSQPPPRIEEQTTIRVFNYDWQRSATETGTQYWAIQGIDGTSCRIWGVSSVT